MKSGDDAAIDDADIAIGMDTTGSNFFAVLQQFAIQLEDALSNPIVTLFYTDLNGDRAMIRSKQELQETVAQFQNQGTLKVYANVVANKRSAIQLKEGRQQTDFVFHAFLCLWFTGQAKATTHLLLVCCGCFDFLCLVLLYSFCCP